MKEIKKKIVSISGIKGIDLENLCLFLYIVMYFFKRFREKPYSDYVLDLEDFIEVNGITRSYHSHIKRVTKDFIVDAFGIRNDLKYFLDLELKEILESKKSTFSLPSIFSTKKAGSNANAKNTKKKSVFSLSSIFSTKKVASTDPAAKANGNAPAVVPGAPAKANGNAAAKANGNAPAVVTGAPAKANGAPAVVPGAITSTNGNAPAPKNIPNNSKPKPLP